VNPQGRDLTPETTRTGAGALTANDSDRADFDFSHARLPGDADSVPVAPIETEVTW